MDLLNQHLSKIRVPGPNDKVYKDECMFSFDNPVSNKFEVSFMSPFISALFTGIRNRTVRQLIIVLRLRPGLRREIFQKDRACSLFAYKT